ncbi:MAG: hypothetical protein LDL41_18670 [Coleofasciculus sp. S288]|nr:hypothetical protein [Coleofasciculus sp. S288]
MRIKNNTTKNYNSIFPPPRRNRAGFTEEEIQDIVRFLETYKIEGAAKAKLLTYIRDRRAAQAIQKRRVKG